MKLRASRLLPILLLVGAGLLGGVEAARAHALLVRSIPEADAELTTPPDTIEMWFSEPLEPGFSSARLLDASGREVPTGAVAFDSADPTHMTLLLGNLEPGIYTVSWQTLSQVDGHEWFGSFPFTVLNPDGTQPSSVRAVPDQATKEDLPTAAEVVFRWLLMVGAMAFAGAALFCSLVVPGPSQLEGLQHSRVRRRVDDLALYALLGAAIALGVGDGGQLYFQALRLGDLDALPRLVLGTRTGALVLARQALIVGGLVLALATLMLPKWLRRRERRLTALATVYLVACLGLVLVAGLRTRSPFSPLAIIAVSGALAAGLWQTRAEGEINERRIWLLIAALSAGTLLTLSVGSHAAAGSGRVWATLGDYLHLAAASAWIGGLLLLPLLVWRTHRAGSIPEKGVLAALLGRFSVLASLSIFTLMVTGLFNGLVELSAFSDLWQTSYGRVLLVKLGLVGLVLPVGYLNNQVVHNRQSELESDDVGLIRLLRQLGLEAFLVMILLVSVSVLVQTPPPRSLTPSARARQAGLPFNAITGADDLKVHVQVTPNQVGKNRFWVHLYHDDGSSIGEVQLVRLFFEREEAQAGGVSVDLESLGQDTFATEGAYLSQPGEWEMEVYVRRRGVDDSLASLDLEVQSAAGPSGPQGPWRNPVSGLSASTLVGGLLASVGTGFWFIGWSRRRLPRGWKVAGAVILIAGVGVAGAGAISAPVESTAGGSASLPENPIPASEASIAQGQVIYENRCQACHGPVGATLDPPPADLRVNLVPGLHSDGQIFEWITNGIPETAMPAFGDVIQEEDRWHLINYIRTFARDGR